MRRDRYVVVLNRFAVVVRGRFHRCVLGNLPNVRQANQKRENVAVTKVVTIENLLGDQ